MNKLLLVLVCLPMFAQAAQPPDCEMTGVEAFVLDTSNRLRLQLREKRFSAIEDELGDKLRRHEEGTFSDAALYSSVENAAGGDIATEPLLAQWATEAPRSFFAHLFKGYYHVRAGFLKRGNGLARDTSSEQFAAMDAEFVKAARELRLASTLHPRSALPHAKLIAIAAATTGSQAVWSVLAEAEKADPGTTAARQQAMRYLAPRWSGSFGALDELETRLSAAALGDPQRRLLLNNLARARAEHYSEMTHEHTKAIQYFRKATEFCPGPSAWRGIDAAAYVLEDWKAVIEANNHLVQLDPQAILPRQRRGWASEKLGDAASAAKDYEAGVQLGDAWSQNRLGTLYALGRGVPKNMERARQLFESAAAKGDAQARVNLESMARQAAGQ